MKDPTIVELSEASDAIVADMPPEIREALDSILDSIIANMTRNLGESPEAWRGAALMALEVMHGILESMEMGIVDNTQRFMLLVLSRFVAQPWAAEQLEAMRAAHEAAS